MTISFELGPYFWLRATKHCRADCLTCLWCSLIFSQRLRYNKLFLLRNSTAEVYSKSLVRLSNAIAWIYHLENLSKDINLKSPSCCTIRSLVVSPPQMIDICTCCIRKTINSLSWLTLRSSSSSRISLGTKSTGLMKVTVLDCSWSKSKHISYQSLCSSKLKHRSCHEWAVSLGSSLKSCQRCAASALTPL